MSGTLDFRNETLDLSIRPRVRQGIPIEIPQIAELVRFTGPFAAPTVSVDAVASATAIARIGAAIGTGGLSVLGETILAGASAGAGACEVALGKDRIRNRERRRRHRQSPALRRTRSRASATRSRGSSSGDRLVVPVIDDRVASGGSNRAPLTPVKAMLGSRSAAA